MRRQYELEKENREKARREQQEAARKIEEIQKKELQAKMEEDIKTLEIEKQRREKPMKEREIKENEQQEEIDTEYEERRKQEFNVREILEKRDEKSSLLNEGSICRITKAKEKKKNMEMKKSTSIGPLRYPDSPPITKSMSPEKGRSFSIENFTSDLPPLK